MHEEPDRLTVYEAVKNAFPMNYEQVYAEMQWSPLHGCWTVVVHGIFVGIEVDGYIHS